MYVSYYTMKPGGGRGGIKMVHPVFRYIPLLPYGQVNSTHPGVFMVSTN